MIAGLQTQLDAAKTEMAQMDATRQEAVTRGDDLDAIISDHATRPPSLCWPMVRSTS